MAAVVLPSARLHGAAGPQSVKPAAASSILALLEEDDDGLKEHGLRKLHAVVDVYWAEAAAYIPQIEALAEDASFAGAQLAASVASKVYYHLESYTDAVRLALVAGHFFNVSTRDEYTDTIVSRCIDEYTTARQAGAAVDPRLEAVVTRMFDRCWEDASWRQALGIALETRRLDIVVETAKRAIGTGSSDGSPLASTSPGAEFLAYALDLVTGAAPATAAGSSAAASATGISFPREWRNTVLRALLPFYAFSAATGSSGGSQQQVFDPITHAHLLQCLDDDEGLAALLVGLVKTGCAAAAASAAALAGAAGAASGGDASSSPASSAPSAPEVLLAYQVALDVVEADDQTMLLRLHARMPAVEAPPAAAAAAPAAASSTPAGDADSAAADAAAAASTPASDAATSSSPAAAAAAPALSVAEVAAFGRLRTILDGSLTTALHLDILSHTSAADPLIFKRTKDAVDARNSILHNAIVVSHAIAHCGTSVDRFLRDNLDWLGKATNWAKFTAAASQGVIHRGRLTDAKQILEAFLPREGEATGDAYSEGGALFALGLIHANRGAAAAAGVAARPGDVASGGSASASAGGHPAESVPSYLLNQLRGTAHAVLQHGSCLALGTASMATGDQEAYAAMRDVLFSSESAVAGEGAALGIGLLLAGKGGRWVSEATGESAADELLGHAHDSDKEKAVRGIGLALALMCYGGEAAAEVLIDELSRDKDAVLRYGGMFALGLAYVGTGDNGAVRRLLHVAVSDVSNDVRRAAVLALGFVMCRQWRELPSLLSHLAESYNPHVRYGAALAIGIACAGTGLPEAVGILEPLATDSTDYVRQGALMALGLVLQEENGTHLPKAAEVREKITKLVGDRHTGAMTRMGAILAQGILDAAGRNGITNMVSRGGVVKMSAAVGMALWLQHWYWYPLFHFLSLSVQPTLLAGLTADFKVASAWSVAVSCPKSWFDYPPRLSDAKEDKGAAVTTVELSTTAKAKAKAAQKAKEKAAAEGGSGATAAAPAAAGGDGTAAAPAAAAASSDAAAAPAAAGAASAGKDDKSAAADTGKEKEESAYVATTPCRVTLGQARFLDWSAPAAASQRYAPVRAPTGSRLGSGIVLLRDTNPAAGPDASLKAIQPPSTTGGEGDEGPEPLAPEVFEWTMGSYY